MDFRYVKNPDGTAYLEVFITDYNLINNPLLSKGMAFTEAERQDFGLLGLLPPHVTNLSTQRERSYLAFQRKSDDLEKYAYLRDLQNSNETLFYSLLTHHIDELLPIVYTPTVGLGCQQFSHIYRRPRGIYISYPYRHHIDKILANKRFDRVKAIVVTDGERILGLGDQGAGGMGIPIGKLALYTACAGIHPIFTLPILLDVGTNNESLLQDPLYIGWRHERIRGKEYDDFIEMFVLAIKKRYPHVLLQWEDFAQTTANPILTRYRNELCTFNDDIQGTAAMVTGALFAAVATKGERLRDQHFVMVGAGSAGCGISEFIIRAIMEEGLTFDEAKSRIYLVDREGLLLDDMPHLLDFQRRFAQPRSILTNWKLQEPNKVSLFDVMNNTVTSVLIGTAGQPNIFTEDIVKLMASKIKKPIIFPLSNPPSKCEADPANLLIWTKDTAIIGAGSPFPPVIKNGRQMRIDQTNNCYIFPGMGLGVIGVKASHVSDGMFMAAAKALAEMSPSKQDPNANLLPPISSIRDVSLHIATRVAETAIHAGLAQHVPNHDLKEYLKEYMWNPVYLPYKKIT